MQGVRIWQGDARLAICIHSVGAFGFVGLSSDSND